MNTLENEQKLWNENSYKENKKIIDTNKFYSVAYNMYDKEKQSVSSLENKIFNEKDRLDYLIAFCIQFKNLYKER